MSINSNYIATLLGFPQLGAPDPEAQQINLALEARKAVIKGMVDGGPPPKPVKVNPGTQGESDYYSILYEA
jgi:hypothetical protein